MIVAPTLAESIHGVALVVGDRGLLILGESGSGKSSLAAAMLAHWPFGKAHLVADDRVMLKRVGHSIVARPHPLIEGKLEMRGYGIVNVACETTVTDLQYAPQRLDAVVVSGVIRLCHTLPQRLPTPEEGLTQVLGVILPMLNLKNDCAPFTRLITIWPYFRGQLCGV